MLTFSFTGVDGTMTECETLTSGMVGKQVQLLFDSSWDNLSKTVVFRVADMNRVVINPASSLVTIPEAVLARPFGKLFVGVCGTDESGTIVIPTVMAEGPMIRYGADPTEDETAKELPVWENLQNQIGDLSILETEQKESLTNAVNGLHRRTALLEANAEQLQEAVSYLGEPLSLETQDRTSLVGAINEIHREFEVLAPCCLTDTTARLLIDILNHGTYSAPQEEAIAALAAAWGVLVTQEEAQPILYWDFRTGSLEDQIHGIPAATADVTLDETGATLTNANAYIMFPAGLDGASLSGHTMEVKFGPMSLTTELSIMRLVCSCPGIQPASSGILWLSSDCWSSSPSVTTEFTDIGMFSNRTLYAKGAPDSNRIDWYCENQLICSSESSMVHSHMSIGASTGAAHPLLVEYVKIYPTV